MRRKLGTSSKQEDGTRGETGTKYKEDDDRKDEIEEEVWYEEEHSREEGETKLDQGCHVCTLHSQEQPDEGAQGV